MPYIMSTIALVYRLTFQAVFSISPLKLPGFVMNNRDDSPAHNRHIKCSNHFINWRTIQMKNKFTTTELVMMAMFTAILCVSAYLSIPTPLPNAAHITLLNFMIILIALVFELRDSTIIIALWMILGAIGVPVFIGGGSGLGYLFGVFGGYTFSFIIASIVIGLIKGKKYNRIKYTIFAILGVVIIDVIGMIWWKFNGNLTWKVAFLSGFVAFIPLDLVKAVIAAQLVPLFKRLLPDRSEYSEQAAAQN